MDTNWVGKIATSIGKKILSDLTSYEHTAIEEVEQTKGYQSPLELQGIAMREAMKPVRYFKREYPYAICNDNGLLRNSNAYLSATEWWPQTANLQKYVVDGEFDLFKGYFDIQTTRTTTSPKIVAVNSNTKNTTGNNQ